MNGHDHTLVRPAPRAQRRPGSERILHVNHAVADLGEQAAERLAEEYFMPVQIPGKTGRRTAALQHERAEAENRVSQWPVPRERGDERTGCTAFLEIPA